MKKRGFTVILVFTVFALSFAVHAQQIMTPQRFRDIAASPGDNVPLNPKLLAVGRIWTNAMITVDLKYADGRKFKEEIPASCRTVKGNYIVTTVTSELYKQPVDTIGAYDETAGCYKFWGLYGEAVSEGLIVYDVDKKTYATHAAYNGGYLEIGVGRYSDTNNWSHTVVLKDGVLFSTRDVNVVPAKPVAK